MNNDLDGLKIIVTGGSRGIGAGIVKRLAMQGASVAFSYGRGKTEAESVLASLPTNNEHFIFPLDISDSASVESGFKMVLERFGQIDGLVNNAGITQDQLILRMKEEDFDRVIATNLKGTYLCTRQVLKPMLRQKKGSIVSITSVVGQTGNPGQCNYAATKAGIEAMMKSVAKEVASRSIRLNCVAPGFIESEMTLALDEKQKAGNLAVIPMERMGTPDEIAGAVAFLLGPHSTYITGHTLSVNGGMFM